MTWGASEDNQIIPFPTKMTYLAGVWLNELPRQLMWETVKGKDDHKRPSQYRALKWSWASIDAPVHFLPYFTNEADSDVQILGTEIIPAYLSAPFGAVKSGHLTLKGSLVAVQLVFAEDRRIHMLKEGLIGESLSHDRSTADSSYVRESYALYGVTLDHPKHANFDLNDWSYQCQCHVWRQECDDCQYEKAGATFYCLKIAGRYTKTFLLIAPSSINGAFQLVGIGRITDQPLVEGVEPGSLFKNATVRTVKLV